MLKSLKNIHFFIFLCVWPLCIVSMEPPQKSKYPTIREAVLADDQDAIVDFMMEHGGDINKEDETGKTLFQLALDEKKRDVAHFMFWHGGIIEPETINDFIRYAFYPDNHEEVDHVELVLMILRESDLSRLIELAKKYSIDWTLALAAAQARVKVVEALLNLKDPRLTQEILDTTAASLNDILKNSTHTDAQRARYRYILYLLKGKNIHAAIENNDYDFVDQYIKDGGDLNVADETGTTPIQQAMKTTILRENMAGRLFLNGARCYSWEITRQLLDSIFGHRQCDRGELAQAIFDDQPGKVTDHIRECQTACLHFALHLSIAQGKVACAGEVLQLAESLSYNSLGEYLQLVHRILKSTSHTPGQRAQYKAIRDLLMVHGQTRPVESSFRALHSQIDIVLSLLNKAP